MARRRVFLDELFSEHIQMPGCPQLIVTRSMAWQQLKAMGYAEIATEARNRFATCDYLVMMKPMIDAPLSPVSLRRRVFAAMNRDAA